MQLTNRKMETLSLNNRQKFIAIEKWSRFKYKQFISEMQVKAYEKIFKLTTKYMKIKTTLKCHFIFLQAKNKMYLNTQVEEQAFLYSPDEDAKSLWEAVCQCVSEHIL